MKKKRLEHNPLVQKRLKENQSIKKKNFQELLRRAVQPSKSLTARLD